MKTIQYPRGILRYNVYMFTAMINFVGSFFWIPIVATKFSTTYMGIIGNTLFVTNGLATAGFLLLLGKSFERLTEKNFLKVTKRYEKLKNGDHDWLNTHCVNFTIHCFNANFKKGQERVSQKYVQFHDDKDKALFVVCRR